MANVNSLFYSTDSDKQTLHKRITPSSDQRDYQQERWRDLKDYLLEDLGEKSGLVMSSWIQGSYKMGTQIRPLGKAKEFDIDLGVYFEESCGADTSVFSPTDLKEFIQESIISYSSESADDLKVLEPAKERCTRISFPEKFHIDVPAYHLNSETDAIELATEKHGWESSDPKKFLNWFREEFSEEENSQIRRIIRYMKAWSLLHLDKPPSSILLTVLVAEAFPEATEGELSNDDSAMRTIADIISIRLSENRDVLNPVDSSENLNRMEAPEIEDLIQSLNSFVLTATSALDSQSEFEAAVIWGNVFFHFFPSPVKETESTNSMALVPVQFVPEISIRAVSDNNDNVKRSGQNKISNIPRGCTIYFHLDNSQDLPMGSHVSWTVRNEEDEAEFVNDLGHIAGTDPVHASEHSAYKGTHYMDITITSAIGSVLGFKRIPVTVDGYFAPPRVSKKPGYLRIQSRRRR